MNILNAKTVIIFYYVSILHASAILPAKISTARHNLNSFFSTIEGLHDTCYPREVGSESRCFDTKLCNYSAIPQMYYLYAISVLVYLNTDMFTTVPIDFHKSYRYLLIY